MNVFIAAIATCLTISGFTQGVSELLPADFLRLLRANHPLAAQTTLVKNYAAMELREARGAFDPKLEAEFYQKYFSDKEYYTIGNAALSWNTFIGLGLEAGYERNQGDLLNSQLFTPDNGLAYFGVNLPLLRGFGTDTDRNTWRKANLGMELALADSSLLMNDLQYLGMMAYAEWSASAEELLVLEEGLDIALFRLNAVKERFFRGDLAAVDTVEALTQVQSRQAELAEAHGRFAYYAGIMASALWQSSEIPFSGTPTPSAQLIERALASLPLKKLVESDSVQLISLHPLITSARIKVQNAEFDRKLAAENIKPKLDLRYRFLHSPTTIQVSEFAPQFNPQDYSLGLSFSLPLLLRNERGKLAQSKIKLLEAQLSLSSKSQEVSTKFSATKEGLLRAEESVRNNESLVNGYTSLLSAENQRFEIGESSLFLVNARETRWIESRRKLVKARAELIKAWAELARASGGMLWDSLMP